MAIKIKNNFVEENIEDEEGNVIGKVRFNPNDSRIMAKLTGIVTNLTENLNKINSLKGDLEKINNVNEENYDEIGSLFNKLHEGFQIEHNVISNAIIELEEIFGKETIELFTYGTEDFESLFPLIEFILPYVNKRKKELKEKYSVKNNDDVME